MAIIYFQLALMIQLKYIISDLKFINWESCCKMKPDKSDKKWQQM